MSWKEAKKSVLECLQEGRFQHEQRGNIDIKNLLATGMVSTAEVMEILRRARGDDHTQSPHRSDRSIPVHVVKRRGWYLKWYFLEPDAIFYQSS